MSNWEGCFAVFTVSEVDLVDMVLLGFHFPVLLCNAFLTLLLSPPQCPLWSLSPSLSVRPGHANLQ